MDRVNPELSFRVHTYGCKVNTYDSGLLQARLTSQGFTLDEEKPQVHILNTCAVTAEATREAVKAARRLKVKNPLSLVVVTGCAAQVDTDSFEKVPGVDLVVANSHKGQLEDLIRKYYSGQLRERIHKSNIFKKEDLEPGGGIESAHTRAFLKIQDGCNSFCTYCVIPFARGKSRSLTIQEIVARLNELYTQGVKEVVLTGIHIGDYRDGEQGLEELIEQVLNQTQVPRLRLTSLEPQEVTPKLLELYSSNTRLCRHFHMSIQSANSKVLFEMKRQYTATAVEESLRQIQQSVPNAFVGMDVIAGFPGESDDEFIDSLERIERLPWTRLHVFPYSARPGTFAARRADPVQQDTIRRRAEILRELSAKRWQEEGKKQIGQIKQALVLKNGDLLSRDYWPLTIAENSNLPVNEEVTVRVTGLDQQRLVGVVSSHEKH